MGYLMKLVLADRVGISVDTVFSNGDIQWFFFAFSIVLPPIRV